MNKLITISLLIIFALHCPLVGQQAPIIGTRSGSIVHLDGRNWLIHTVVAGETLYSIARLYGTTPEQLAGGNPLSREGVRVGEVVKIPAPTTKPERLSVRATSRLFDRHTVAAGETAYSIAARYGIALSTLMTDNPYLDPAKLAIGNVINIRKKEQGETSPAEIHRQWESYRETANRASDRHTYHIVQAGETLYLLSRSYDVPVETIIEVNGLTAPLQAGSMVRIPIENQPAVSTTIGFRSVPEATSTPRIAIMLPLGEGGASGLGAAGSDFIEFYKGALLAFEDLKAAGHSARVTLYNTARSAEKVAQIVSEPYFATTDLIIGPVYEAELAPALGWAESNNVPLASPLVTVRSADSEVLWQMAPDPATKYDKLRLVLAGRTTPRSTGSPSDVAQTSFLAAESNLPEAESNVILVSSASGNDAEMEREITAQIAQMGIRNYGRFTIGAAGADDGSGPDVASLIDWDRPNVLVVLARGELAVNDALTTISSAYNNASARRSRRAQIAVVGSARWAGYGASVDKNLFFKLNTHFVTSYYTDRSSDAAVRFDSRFLETYGDLPTRAAYRGYDAVTIFVGRFFNSTTPDFEATPIGTTYRFVQRGGLRRHINDNWSLVSFTDDYNITVR